MRPFHAELTVAETLEPAFADSSQHSCYGSFEPRTEMLISIFHSLDQALCVLDSSGHVMICNALACRLIPDLIVNISILDALPAALGPAHAHAVSAVLKNQRRQAVTWRTADGHRVRSVLTPGQCGQFRYVLMALEVERQECTPEGMSSEARAIALLYEHPEWTDTQIAEYAGVSRTSLYRWSKYVAARAMLRQGRQKFAGYRDGNSGWT